MEKATTKKALTNLNEKFRDHVRSDSPECDTDLNDSSRKLVAAMVKDHGTVYLGNINLYGEDRKKPVKLTSFAGGRIVLNFEYGFVLPVNDDVIVRLIEERDQRAYTGTADDAPLVDAIIDRITEVGGHSLFWS